MDAMLIDADCYVMHEVKLSLEFPGEIDAKFL